MSDKSVMTRNQLDSVLAAWCEAMGVKYSTEHDDAFCIVSLLSGDWIYLWYDADTNVASEFINRLELHYKLGHLPTTIA